MRLTSEFYTAALMRRVSGQGGFAAILRKGAAEAGAIFLVIGTGRLGDRALYGPAPQTVYEESRPADRAFALLQSGTDPDEIDARIEREARFDPDLWVVDLDLGDLPVADFVELTKP